MTNEKMKWIKAYLKAKTGDKDLDVDEALVHYWKPFSEEDIREVADMLTKNDLRRFANRHWRYVNDGKEFYREFGIEFADEDCTVNTEFFGSKEEYLKCKDSEMLSDTYCGLVKYLNEHELDKKTWNKFLNWYNQFGFDFTFEKTIAGKVPYEIITNLEEPQIPLHKIDKSVRGDMQDFWNLQCVTRMNKWFEENVEGYENYFLNFED